MVRQFLEDRVEAKVVALVVPTPHTTQVLVEILLLMLLAVVELVELSQRRLPRMDRRPLVHYVERLVEAEVLRLQQTQPLVELAQEVQAVVVAVQPLTQ